MSTVTARHLVMPKDLNPANRLFGGQMMAWLDEAAALYVMCQTGSQNIVTAKVSEVSFDKPVIQGDFLVFYADLVKVGTSSLTVRVTVFKKEFGHTLDDKLIGVNSKVCACEMVFVTVDPETGKSKPHGIKHEKVS